MEKRLLGRGQGRTDDNVETIKKRFKVHIFSESSNDTLPDLQEVIVADTDQMTFSTSPTS